MNRRLPLLLPAVLGLAGAMAVVLVGGLSWRAGSLALFLALAGLALDRQMASCDSACKDSIAHYLAAQQEFGAQVAPVWSGHIESSRSQMESAIFALSQRFAGIVDKLDEALNTAILEADIQHGFQLGNIMPVCCGHDELQRDATTVHQQMAFAPIFFPDRWDWVQRFAVLVALSSSRCQCFAIARQCLQTRRIGKSQYPQGFKDACLFPLQEPGMNRDGTAAALCGEVLSIDSLFSIRTPCFQIRVQGLWAWAGSIRMFPVPNERTRKRSTYLQLNTPSVAGNCRFNEDTQCQ